MDKTWNYFYKVVNIIHEHVTKVKHLLHFLRQIITNQQATMMLQIYTKHNLFYATYA